MKENLKTIERWLNFNIYNLDIPGLSVGIVKNDKLVFHQTYGFSNLKRKQKTAKNTNYRIASISKLFTSISIMQLAEKEKLSLDDRISKYLPWIEERAIGNTRIKQLLKHTAKIKRDGDFPFWTSEIFPESSEIKESFKNKQGVNIPNKWKYSNLGFSLLGEIINNVSGKSYPVYVKENIIDKLQLKNTHPDMNDNVRGLATGYSRKIKGKNRRAFPNPETKSMMSATGFISNVEDLSKIIISLLNDTKLISEKSKKEIFKKHSKISKDFFYGLGCEIWPMKKDNIFGHSGGFAGFKTSLGINLRNKTGVIFLSNTINIYPVQFMKGIFEFLHLEKSKKYKHNFVNEGIYYNKWGYVQIAKTPKGVVGFYPTSYTPLSQTFKLKYLNNKTYRIVETNNEYVGENLEFLPDDKIKIGPNYWKKLKLKKQ